MKVFFILLIVCISVNTFANENSPDSLQTTIHDNWFAVDKAHHFITSAYLVALGNYVADKELNVSHGSLNKVAIGFSFSFGIFKELYDGTVRKTHFSYKDLVADIAGITIGLIILNNVE